MCRGVNVPCICQSFYTQQVISSARYVFTTTTPTAPLLRPQDGTLAAVVQVQLLLEVLNCLAQPLQTGSNSSVNASHT